MSDGTNEATAAKRLEELEARLDALEKKKRSMSLVCFSCEYDRLYAAFNMAVGAATMGAEVKMFFSFWGAKAMEPALGKPCRGSWLELLFSACFPRRISRLPLSRMNFLGFGPILLRRLMKRKHIDDLEQMIAHARELGVRFYLCEKSAEMMGLTVCPDAGIDECGVSTFVANALNDSTALFI